MLTAHRLDARLLPTVTLAVFAIGSPLTAQQPDSTATANRPTGCTSGGIGGTALVSARAGLAYAIDFADGGPRLMAVMVARGPRGFLDHRYKGPWPLVPVESSGAGGGGTVGPIAFQYDETRQAARIGDRQVALGQDNVVLVEWVGGAGGSARVIGTARVDPALPVPAEWCTSARATAWTDALNRALLATVQRSPAARAFMRR